MSIENMNTWALGKSSIRGSYPFPVGDPEEDLLEQAQKDLLEQAQEKVDPAPIFAKVPWSEGYSKGKFTSLLNETFESIFKLTNTKGEEYSRSDDQLGNFRRSAAEARLTMEQVWLVFFNKHIDSIKSYIVNGGQVKSTESIESRIDDAILYLILLKAIAEDKSDGGH